VPPLVHPTAHLILRLTRNVESDHLLAPQGEGFRTRLSAKTLPEFFKNNLTLVRENNSKCTQSFRTNLNTNLVAHCINLRHVEEDVKLINRSSMSTLMQMCTNHAPTGEYFKCHVWKYQNKPPSFFMCPCHKSEVHNYPPVLQTHEHIIRACPLFEDAREKLALAFPGIRMPQRSLGQLIKKKHVEHTLEFLKSGAFSRHHAPYEPP